MGEDGFDLVDKIFSFFGGVAKDAVNMIEGGELLFFVGKVVGNGKNVDVNMGVDLIAAKRGDVGTL